MFHKSFVENQAQRITKDNYENKTPEVFVSKCMGNSSKGSASQMTNQRCHVGKSKWYPCTYNEDKYPSSFYEDNVEINCETI